MPWRILNSTDARTMMKNYPLGELMDEDKSHVGEQSATKWAEDSNDNSSSWKTWLVPIAYCFAYIPAKYPGSSVRIDPTLGGVAPVGSCAGNEFQNEHLDDSDNLLVRK
ncbi:unnamed protein product [Allacma fusca]|uniref:Uncharacterized protein n=1 Tax=Allacma fusca TaxID=39272 RepID=A0A8J2KKZ5_9HEXA|nr:unnamed protein product [Allacma fusca]